MTAKSFQHGANSFPKLTPIRRKSILRFLVKHSNYFLDNSKREKSETAEELIMKHSGQTKAYKIRSSSPQNGFQSHKFL
ncbi:hypothetical protein TNCT_185881 [Trichonephila clavata]|uniref:Uncharacterized protein n=1 Tax=Trichonephila clavata TaxID=2740835 RepID=A0A8X6LZM1_TRICU|nr:hypothetical protein TNCT_185881 [Trichonephila clavata]